MARNASLYDLLMSVKPDDLTENAWASRAGVSRSWFGDIKKGARARTDTLEKVVGAIGMTLAQFYDMDGANAAAPPALPRRRELPFTGPAEPLDIPHLGTAQGSDMEIDVDGSVTFVERMDLNASEVIEYLRRPAALTGRRDVYAISVIGDSVSPAYSDGDPAYVDPRRQPQRDDFVVVQLKRPTDADSEQLYISLFKKLVRRTSSYIELQQLNPDLTFQVPLAEVHAIHRVIPWKEIVYF